MIEFKMPDIEELCTYVKEQAIASEARKLLSVTCEIQPVDSLQVYTQYMKKYKQATYWLSADRADAVVGLGSVLELTSAHTTLDELEQKWKETVAQATIHRGDACIQGPLIVGGVAFDPVKPTTELWQAFPSTAFQLPEITYVMRNEKSYLIFNHWVTAETDCTKLIDSWQQDMQQIQMITPEVLSGVNKIEAEVEIAREPWIELVKNARETIRRTQTEKIVLAREVELTYEKLIDIGVLLAYLEAGQKNSYLFAYKKADVSFVGATPERLISVKDSEVLSTCLAGTAPRGITVEQDREMRETLLDDRKNLEEHDYVVQMIRTALEQHCHEIEIAETPIIYPLEQLQHLYTPVTAKLNKGETIFQLVESLHPTPALGGTPKAEALEFIRTYEFLDRGWYGAPVGWVDAELNGEFAVAIRSGLVSNKKAHLFAGCGVVKDSDPELEYEETKIKLKPMLEALRGLPDGTY